MNVWKIYLNEEAKSTLKIVRVHMLDKFRLNKRFDDMECGFNFRPRLFAGK